MHANEAITFLKLGGSITLKAKSFVKTTGHNIFAYIEHEGKSVTLEYNPNYSSTSLDDFVIEALFDDAKRSLHWIWDEKYLRYMISEGLLDDCR